MPVYFGNAKRRIPCEAIMVVFGDEAIINRTKEFEIRNNWANTMRIFKDELAFHINLSYIGYLRLEIFKLGKETIKASTI